MKRKLFQLMLVALSFGVVFPLLGYFSAQENKVCAATAACDATLDCPTGFKSGTVVTKHGDVKLCKSSIGNSVGEVALSVDGNSYGCFTGFRASVISEDGTAKSGDSVGDYRCCPTNSPNAVAHSFAAAHTDWRVVCCPANYTTRFDGESNIARPSWIVDNPTQSLQWNTPGSSSGASKCYDTTATGDLGPEHFRDGTGEYELLQLSGKEGGFNYRNYNYLYLSAQIPSGYTCPSTNCIAVGGDFNVQSPVPTTAPECQNSCYTQGSELTKGSAGDSVTKYCLNHVWLSRDDYLKQVNVPQGCTVSKNVNDVNACKKCLFGTVDAPASATPIPGRVVTSFTGCLDVSRDGIITRIFQIGIGLIGGAMVVRIIQAAFMMQTDNPEKIREAREIIGSAIIAILVLVGSVTILRFLGINVLNVLPSDFLQATPVPVVP